MKKQKISLEELKVESFVTHTQSSETLKGGTSTLISLSVAVSAASYLSCTYLSEACPVFSDGDDCTFSAL